MDRFIVITGGPGSGKSTLIEALARRGLAIMPEAGRAIIRDQVAIDGPALPWADREAFAALMLGWELRSWHEASTHGERTFFDRGVVDVIGYLTLCGLPVPAHVERAAERFRYNGTVFVAPPWEAIFTQDRERRQSLDEAMRTCEAMRMAYRKAGYRLVDLPLAPVEDRVGFVLAHLGEKDA